MTVTEHSHNSSSSAKKDRIMPKSFSSTVHGDGYKNLGKDGALEIFVKLIFDL